MKVRILSDKEVEECLKLEELIGAIGAAMAQLSAGQATVPLRTQLPMEKGTGLIMPAFLPTSSDCCVKVATVFGQNTDLGLPVVNATSIVLDSETGLPKAFLNSETLTTLRTGACGALATDLLARKDARSVAVFGAGVQADVQLRGLLLVRQIEEVTIYSRTRQRAIALREKALAFPNAPAAIHIAESPREAVAAADIVIAATTSTSPVFDGNDLKPGTHVSGVGSFRPDMQEIDSTTVNQALIVVDSKQGCCQEAGDLIQAGATNRVHAEIGEIVRGTKPGRSDDQQITFYKSVGVAAQDALAAGLVLRKAEAMELGTLVQL